MHNLQIFVSYSSKDNKFVVRLVEDLRRALNDESAVWYDTRGGLHGSDLWWRKIMEELRTREVFIVVLSPDATQSTYVNLEIDLAWRHKHKQWNRLIIPILHRECTIRDDLDILQLSSFLPPKSYEQAFDELLTARRLHTEVQQRQARAQESAEKTYMQAEEERRAWELRHGPMNSGSLEVRILHGTTISTESVL